MHENCAKLEENTFAQVESVADVKNFHEVDEETFREEACSLAVVDGGEEFIPLTENRGTFFQISGFVMESSKIDESGEVVENHDSQTAPFMIGKTMANSPQFLKEMNESKTILCANIRDWVAVTSSSHAMSEKFACVLKRYGKTYYPGLSPHFCKVNSGRFTRWK